MNGSPPASKPPRSLGRTIAVAAPLVAFAALAAIFLYRIETDSDPSLVPSVLIGKPAPATALAPLAGAGVPAVASADFKGVPTLVNVWASWCVPCREEHPILEKLASDKRIRLVGINYKDQDDNALRFLGAFGNPFSAIGVDPDGRAAIDWGVYGVPETFLIGADGTIRYKYIGPISEEGLATVLMPEIEKAVAAAR